LPKLCQLAQIHVYQQVKSGAALCKYKLEHAWHQGLAKSTTLQSAACALYPWDERHRALAPTLSAIPYVPYAPMSNWLTTSKTRLTARYRNALREKAIAQAKVEIALAGRKVTDYDHEQLELIVKDQETKILHKYRNSAFVVLLLALGIA
jgi:hypothetical protein